MKATKILENEISACAVASLPTRPTSSLAFGGGGYTPTQLKNAFDRLPRLVSDRLNMLLDDILDGEIAESIPTGITESHTLAKLFSDIADGSLASYLSVGERSLFAEISELKAKIAALEGGAR